MQSRCRSPNFFAKAFSDGRAFCRRFYTTTIGIKKLNFLIKVTHAKMEDARLLIQFFES